MPEQRIIGLVLFIVALSCPDAARANEIDGLNSNVPPTTTYTVNDASTYLMAYRSMQGAGGTLAITIESGETDGTGGGCEGVLNLPAGTQAISHPALSASGWLAVTAQTCSPSTPCWNLWMVQNPTFTTNPCGGWSGGVWTRFPLPSGWGSPATAPAFAQAATYYDYIFLADDQHIVDFLINNHSGGGTPGWSSWQFVSTSNTSAEPSAIYDRGDNEMFLFTSDTATGVIFDHTASVGLFSGGGLSWNVTTQRDFNMFRNETMAGQIPTETPCVVGGAENSTSSTNIYMACVDAGSHRVYVTAYTPGSGGASSLAFDFGKSTLAWSVTSVIDNRAATGQPISLPLFGFRSHFNNAGYVSLFDLAPTCGSPCTLVHRNVDHSNISGGRSGGSFVTAIAPTVSVWSVDDADLDFNLGD